MVIFQPLDIIKLDITTRIRYSFASSRKRTVILWLASSHSGILSAEKGSPNTAWFMITTYRRRCFINYVMIFLWTWPASMISAKFSTSAWPMYAVIFLIPFVDPYHYSTKNTGRPLPVFLYYVIFSLSARTHPRLHQNCAYALHCEHHLQASVLYRS